MLGRGPGALRRKSLTAQSLTCRTQLFLTHFCAYFPSHLRSTHSSCWPGNSQRATCKCLDKSPWVPTVAYTIHMICVQYAHDIYDIAGLQHPLPPLSWSPQRGGRLRKVKASPQQRQSAAAPASEMRKSPICIQFMGRTVSSFS